jgi:hypothetical protein
MEIKSELLELKIILIVNPQTKKRRYNPINDK